MKEQTITAVILTKNNEATIKELISSLSWCTEIIILDDQSTDSTSRIAKQMGASVIVHPLHSDYSAHRNSVFTHIHTQWVLFIDSDEEVSSELGKEIMEKISLNEADGFAIKRHDVMYGKELLFGETAHISLVRLAKLEAGRWKGQVHEEWHIQGVIQPLTHVLLHKPHPTIAEFLSEINRYSTLVALEKNKNNEQVTILTILFYPVGKFIQNYLLRQGYRDGIRGALMAIMMSFHSFLVRSKLYVLKKSAAS